MALHTGCDWTSESGNVVIETNENGNMGGGTNKSGNFVAETNISGNMGGNK
jgi:hypothetical protein